jgi:hypothetical protein
VLVFLLLWIGAFASLGLSLLLLSCYFRILGTELSLNSVPKELALGLIASAAQAGAVWFVLPFLKGAPQGGSSGRALAIFPMLFCVLLYKLAHLADWDQYESGGLAFFQLVIVIVGVLFIGGQFGFATFVLTAFATALLLIGAVVKQA